MIPNSQIDDIRNKADIVAVISEYVPLKKRGKNYLGLCPFHSEKTPSFTVSPDKGIWHCFGCNEGGNVFAFLSKIENMSFVESVIMLGDKVGIKVESKGDPRENAERERYTAIMGLAADFYAQLLKEEEGKPARDYIDKRGISADVVEKFKLGYAPERWEALYEFLFKKGVPPKDMLGVGLVLERKDGTGYYDRFRNRLMFPIMNIRGKAIGFSGRTLGQDDAKYINSPDSPIYNKGYNLYGLNLTKDAIKREDFTILVEGNVDLLTCYQFGIMNVVAPLGTAFTNNQAKLLARSSKNVIIMFDKDAAGLNAASKSSQILRDNDISVFVAAISQGKDPDEAIRKYGKEKFIEDLKTAKPWMEFMIGEILKKHNLSQIEGRSKAVKEAAEILLAEKDQIAIREYIKLLSQKTGIDASTVEAEVKKQDFYLKKPGYGSSRSSVDKPSSKLVTAEETLVKLVMDDISLIGKFKEKLDWNEFTNSVHRTIAEILQTVDISGVPKDGLANLIMESIPDEEGKKMMTRITVTELPGGDHGKMFEDCANTIKAYHLKSKLDELRVEINDAEKMKDFEKVSELHRRYNECSAQFRTLEKVI